MKIKMRKAPFDIDVKRFYLPAEIKARCPECGSEVVKDFDQDYLMYPTANKKFAVTIYCDGGESGHEFVRAGALEAARLHPNDARGVLRRYAGWRFAGQTEGGYPRIVKGTRKRRVCSATLRAPRGVCTIDPETNRCRWCGVDMDTAKEEP